MDLNSHNYKVKKQRTQKSENILPIILFPPISLSSTGELSKRVLMVLDQLLHYIHYLSIPLVTNSWSDIIRTLFENSPVLLCGPKKKHIEEIGGGGHFRLNICISFVIDAFLASQGRCNDGEVIKFKPWIDIKNIRKHS